MGNKIFKTLGTIGLFALCAIILLNQYLVWQGLEKVKSDYKTEIEEKIKLESQQRQEQIDKTKKELGQIRLEDTTFGYIMAKQPALSTRQVADIITETFKCAEEFNMNPYTIFAMEEIESSFKPWAKGNDGERGLIQPLKSTFNLYKKQFNYTDKDFNDWRCTLRVGVAYMADLLKKYNGNWEKALANYNAGCGIDMFQKAKKHLDRYYIASRGLSKLSDRKRD
jgi:hypothetical protein